MLVQISNNKHFLLIFPFSTYHFFYFFFKNDLFTLIIAIFLIFFLIAPLKDNTLKHLFCSQVFAPFLLLFYIASAGSNIENVTWTNVHCKTRKKKAKITESRNPKITESSHGVLESRSLLVWYRRNYVLNKQYANTKLEEW